MCVTALPHVSRCTLMCVTALLHVSRCTLMCVTALPHVSRCTLMCVTALPHVSRCTLMCVTAGAYPLHYHMCDDAKGSWLRGNAIEDSFSRCITIHGTDEVEVR
eukprot:TRINITY_DN25970_c0_g1_i1.p1 TRINITY_DN25970_c0_g1~~TRINITY_DN25970_c0_g1_i1.p1  ORF type:complete len:104 (-),score=21.80 TRINITY_DN25970_c0_g1_i1:21-332(-)